MGTRVSALANALVQALLLSEIVGLPDVVFTQNSAPFCSCLRGSPISNSKAKKMGAKTSHEVEADHRGRPSFF